MIENIKSIQKSIKTTSRYLKLMMDSGEFRDQNEAFIMLKACLKALRDRLGSDEAVHLGAQLPALLRGFYFEGWSKNSPPKKKRNISEFLKDIRTYLNGYDQFFLQKTVPITMKVILDMIDQGEAIQIIHAMPKDVRELYP